MLGALVALIVLACACGTTTRTTKPGPVAAPKLPPVKPEALREFDAGMRALRLGGPEAHERAVPRLLEATRLDGKLWEAWHNLGVVYTGDGDDEAAAEAFTRALDVNPAHTPALLGRAEAYRRMGKYGKARKDYETALSRDPEDARTRLRLASLLREEGKLDDAVDTTREALRHSSDPQILVELGLIYLAQGRDELAELVLQRAVRHDDQNPVAWNALALVSLARGRDQEAFERFDHATALDPSYRDARFNKASVLLGAGNYQAAESELRAVVKQDPDDFGARVALGVAERGLGKYDRARATWEGVVKDAPRKSIDRGDALYNLAVLEMDHIKDEAKSRAALDRYLQDAPGRHPKRSEAKARRKELGE